MTDRELIEKAALAAGIELAEQPFVHNKGCGALTRDGWIWSPLNDDGDALRLAVKLRLVIHVWDDGETTSCAKTLPDGNDPHPDSDTWHSAVAHASIDGLVGATRRAIVRAAAEIGASK